MSTPTPWTRVLDETGQWVWYHRERGEKIVIGAEDGAEDSDFGTLESWDVGTAPLAPVPLPPQQSQQRRQPQQPQQSQQRRQQQLPAPQPQQGQGHRQLSVLADVGAMSAAALRTWLESVGATPECLAAVDRRGMDGAALMGVTSDPFGDGLGELGIRDPLLRGRLLEAVSLQARHDATVAAAEWDSARQGAAAAASKLNAAGTAAAAAVPAPTASAKPRRAPQELVDVQVGYKVDALGEVDCLRALFFAHFKIFATWTDPALRECSLYRAEQLHVHAQQEKMVNWEREHGLLQPELIVLNGHELACSYYEMRLTDRAVGTVKWSKHFSGWLNLEIGLSLENFPFDYHDLRICLRCRTMDKQHCSLRVWPGTHSTEFQEESNEWQLLGHRIDLLETDPAASPTGKIYEELHVCIMVQRFFQWYMYNVVIFLFALVIMSVGVYAMPFAGSEAIGGRTQVSVSLIFAVIALKFVVVEHIPRVHYRTFFDEYVIMCFFFVTVSGIQSLLMYKFSDVGTAEHPRQPMFSSSTNNYINLATSSTVAGAFVLYHVLTRRRLVSHRERQRKWCERRLRDDAAQTDLELRRSRSTSHRFSHK